MSMLLQGSATLACVCRCRNGFCRASRPWIHIFAGLNVCIQAMRPMVRSLALASRAIRRMLSESLRTGFHTTRTGMSDASSSCRAISCDCSATCWSVSSP